MIKFENNTFTLTTDNSQYVIKISEHNHLLHLYYGAPIADDDLYYICKRPRRTGFDPIPNDAPNEYSLALLPQEYSSDGVGDFRYSSVSVKNSDGSYAFEGRYVSHRITEGKYSLKEMPSLFAADSDTVHTLEIVTEDSASGVRAVLYYSVFEQLDIITRAVKIINGGKGKINLLKAMSATLDLRSGDYDMLHFRGHHYLERLFERVSIDHAAVSVGSVCGSTSHQHNPGVVICDKDTTESFGNCYGVLLMYTGNFIINAKKDEVAQTRINVGINPEKFDFVLESGDEFETPEAVLTFSSDGFAKMSHSFHDAFRNNACRSKYMKQRRPVLVNNWEATRFDFTGKKILDIAREGKKLGADLFVLDDGWFGARDNDRAGLGDWVINQNKMGGDMASVIKQVNDMGLMFGLWFEPEMINEDSDLYRAHPDWALTIPGRAPARGRNQLVLDITREDVRDYLITSVNKILDENNIGYVKWDFNRYLTDVYSRLVDSEHQGEIMHRFVLGFYKLLDGIILSHPDILFEGCSGGGGRFDGAMLCYQPQIWCSDDTDAVWRTHIQYGTSFFYPCSSMGAHVSVCPNKKTGRSVPFETRATVAMSGTFGYELDTTMMTEEEKALCKQLTDKFRQYQDVITFGDYYRLVSPTQNGRYTAWMHVSKDKTEALVSIVMLDGYPNDAHNLVKLTGLNPDFTYSCEDFKLSAKTLMNVGIPLDVTYGQYQSVQFYLKKV